VFLCLLAHSNSYAQFTGQGERVGNQLSGDRVRDRINRQQKGGNITEWVRRLKNDRPETRLEAVKSLGTSKDPKAIEHLMTATADTDIRVKNKAIEYLGNLRATDATPVLVQQLFLRDVSQGIKHKILVALGKIGDPRGAEPIMEFLKRRLDMNVKAVAIRALSDVGNDNVLAFLDDVSRTDPSQPLRQLAADAAPLVLRRNDHVTQRRTVVAEYPTHRRPDHDAFLLRHESLRRIGGKLPVLRPIGPAERR